MMSMAQTYLDDLRRRREEILERVDIALGHAGRSREDVKIMAVSKTVDIDAAAGTQPLVDHADRNVHRAVQNIVRLRQHVPVVSMMSQWHPKKMKKQLSSMLLKTVL